MTACGFFPRLGKTKRYRLTLLPTLGKTELEFSKD